MKKDLERIRSLLDQEDYAEAAIILDDLIRNLEDPEPKDEPDADS